MKCDKKYKSPTDSGAPMERLLDWADGAGLKHHCPVCQAPLASEKARKHCVGNHVEWCHRHHSVFRRNWSVRCQACKNMNEQHEKRHREIAVLISEIRKASAATKEAENDLTVPNTPNTPTIPLAELSVNASPSSNSSNMHTSKMTRKERKAAKKAAKATGLGRDKVITTADIKLVATTLHPNGTENVREEEDSTDEKMASILTVLEFDTNATGKYGGLVTELQTAIRKDLAICASEMSRDEEREESFWRWASKRAYKDLLNNGGAWDAYKDGKERKPIVQSHVVAVHAVEAVEAAPDEQDEAMGVLGAD